MQLALASINRIVLVQPMPLQRLSKKIWSIRVWLTKASASVHPDPCHRRLWIVCAIQALAKMKQSSLTMYHHLKRYLSLEIVNWVFVSFSLNTAAANTRKTKNNLNVGWEPTKPIHCCFVCLWLLYLFAFYTSIHLSMLICQTPYYSWLLYYSKCSLHLPHQLHFLK